MTFKVGDVCELVYSTRPETQCYVGTEYIVTSELREFHNPVVGFWMGHRVVRCDGTQGQALPSQLRLKRPPNYPEQFSAGDWDLCPWQPGKVKQAEPADRWEKWRTRERT